MTYKVPLECPKCDGQHDHQLGFVEKRCPKCGSRMVEVMRVSKH